MPGLKVTCFACRFQFFPAILPDRLKKAIAALCLFLEYYQRFVGKLGQIIKNLEIFQIFSGADLLGGFEAPAPRKDGQSSPQNALTLAQKVITPLDQGA